MKSLLPLIVFGCLIVIAVARLVRAEHADTRIIGARPAAQGQFPWMAAIYVTRNTTVTFCGGSLITQSHVLTAAHCIDGALSFTIYLGANTLNGIDNNRVIINTDIAFIHPDYAQSFLDDVGIIAFTDQLVFNDFIQPIQLQFSLFITLTRLVHISGWGQTVEGSNELSQELNFMNYYSINNDECQEYYGTIINQRVLCAKPIELESGICGGDLGGPLMFYDLNGVATQIGVAAFVSSAGCSSDVPSGYARINYAGAWIRGITAL